MALLTQEDIERIGYEEEMTFQRQEYKRNQVTRRVSERKSRNQKAERVRRAIDAHKKANRDFDKMLEKMWS